MAVSASAKSLSLFNHLRTCTKAMVGLPIASTMIFCRKYKPYSKTPKQFLEKTKKTRIRSNSDDVFLLKYQDLPLHTAEDAIDMARSFALFQPESVQLVIQILVGEGRCNLRTRDGIVFFPHPLKRQNVLVLADGEKADEARNAGAAIVGGRELLDGLEEGTVRYRHCITTPDFYPEIKHLGKSMRATFPHPRRGTVTNDISDAVQKFSAGQPFKLKAPRWETLKFFIGTTDFTREQMKENFDAVLKAIHQLKSTNVGNANYYRRAYIGATSMQKARLDVAAFDP